ncbi:NADH:flavin oxidoreductase [Amycolatopsis endophytica]|uniref:2,4-dienoyl-CoA reductase (NADPH2) n=1 Tax=Amycolatopsis endophytica TaxID=860233 RepID=A0A853BA77_9PSEU|nr:FAD-dependent oxidoreductase [Amycolatopsis endophytica]NYI92273.1 2,4-dienoyl-CoA reductase (NADPH2) [Amycolatopsis endophytica]
METFEHAFSPFRLGPLTLRNRLVALPAGTSMAEQGVPTHGDTEHFGRLAAGGVGMIIGGATVVHRSSTLRSRKLVEAYVDEFVPAAAAKARVVHRHGAKFIGQLCHLGREFIGGESDSPPVAPSPIKTARDAYPPHELTVREIEDIVEGWRISTENLVQAGADGAEIHAAHGYLPAQFLSPLTNRRTDSFGGSFGNRMRFTRMVLAAMRSVVPEGFVIGVRLSGEEEIPGGMGIDDCVRIAEDLACLGADYFSITHGTRGNYVKDAGNPDAVAVPSAARVRAATGLPTLVGQRIRDAATAEHIVKSGHADLVGMARALIADPDLPEKSRTGRLAEVRGCLGINQDCRAFDPHLHCAVNAEVGRGRHPNLGVPAPRSKEVYVIGGGPAGLEAARVAAGRGHRVTVFERSTRLGGTVRVAAESPHRATIIDIVDYLGNEMKRLRVEVNLAAGIEADDFAEILSLADHVVLATGSKSAGIRPGLAARASATIDDVLLGKVPEVPGRRALVYDEGDGFWPAYSAAESLLRDGWQVTFATPLTGLATRVPAESAGPLLRRLGAGGVELLVGHEAVVPGDASEPVLLRPAFGGGTQRRLEDVLTVWHSPRVPVDALVREVPEGAPVTVIGDCRTPRRISHAIAEGYQAGARI